MLIPLILALGAEELIPQISHPMNRDFGAVLQSADFHAVLHGSWTWFAIYHLHVPWWFDHQSSEHHSTAPPGVRLTAENSRSSGGRRCTPGSST